MRPGGITRLMSQLSLQNQQTCSLAPCRSRSGPLAGTYTYPQGNGIIHDFLRCRSVERYRSMARDFPVRAGDRSEHGERELSP